MGFLQREQRGEGDGFLTEGNEGNEEMFLLLGRAMNLCGLAFVRRECGKGPGLRREAVQGEPEIFDGLCNLGEFPDFIGFDEVGVGTQLVGRRNIHLVFG